MYKRKVGGMGIENSIQYSERKFCFQVSESVQQSPPSSTCHRQMAPYGLVPELTFNRV